MTETVFAPGYQLTITRIFDAPRELVFDCFTDEAHMAAWWGPRGFSAPQCRLDPTPGGEIFIYMEGPTPEWGHPMGGEYVELERPSRLVFVTKAFQGEDGEWGIDNYNELDFAEEDGKTVLTLTTTVRKVSAEILPALGGMEQGWNESLDKLAEHMAEVG